MENSSPEGRLLPGETVSAQQSQNCPPAFQELHSNSVFIPFPLSGEIFELLSDDVIYIRSENPSPLHSVIFTWSTGTLKV